MDMELFKEIASKCNGSVIDGCLKEITHLRQQIAAHTASQIDRGRSVAEACAKLAENRKPRFSEFSTPSKDIAQEIRDGEWRKHLGETK